MKLSEVTIGKTFSVAGIEFIKFTDENGVCAAVSKDILFNSEFGENNNFAKSTVLKKLNKDILPKIEAEVGAENIKEFELDLTSLDGLDTYGKINTKIGLPTFDFYRKNVRIFAEYNPKDWWWTATPDTTKEHYNENWITCVSPLGRIFSNLYNYNSGVRPFLYFESSISVSCEE